MALALLTVLSSPISINNQENFHNTCPKARLMEATLKWGSLSAAVWGRQPQLFPHLLSPQGKVCSSPTFYSSRCSAHENDSTPLRCLPLLHLFLPSTGRQSLGSGIIKNDTGIIKKKRTPRLVYAPGATWVASCCLGQCANAQVFPVPCRVEHSLSRSNSPTFALIVPHILQTPIHLTSQA